MRIYALHPGRQYITRADLEKYIDEKHAAYIWCIVQRGGFNCRLYYYSEYTDTLKLNSI